MPINTNLNTAPYFDDFDLENQYYRVLFKPGYALQARELTQLQSVLQSQIEQFGDNIFQEGSIVKGCNFTNLNDLKFVRLQDDSVNEGTEFNPTEFISRRVTTTALPGGGVGVEEIEYDWVFQVVGATTGLIANIVSASQGFESRPPDLNTFFINYLNSNESAGYKEFQDGELLTINKYWYKTGVLEPAETNPVYSESGVDQISCSQLAPALLATGKSFGVQAAPGVIFQKGHFLFADAQTLVVSKYDGAPNGKAVGYQVTENLITALQDATLYDNANGSTNENAPGADRLRLTPQLVVLDQAVADNDPSFFSLIKYRNGNAVTIRDVSQYNVIGSEMARRTYEESGNYILQDFNIKTDRRNGDLKVLVGSGTAYVKGYRVESTAPQEFTIDPISGTETIEQVPIGIDYGNFIKLNPATAHNGALELDFIAVDLMNGGSAIGTGFVANVTPTKVYIFGARMNSGQSFSNVNRIRRTSTGTYVEFSAGATLEESRRAPKVFTTGMNSVSSTTNVTIPERKVITGATPSGNDFILTPAGGNNFALNQDDVLVIDGSGVYHAVSNITYNVGFTQMTITCATTPAAGATIFYNENNVGVTPYGKVSATTHVRPTYQTNKKRYSLGVPDVYRLISVTDVNGRDVTPSFRLINNQKDHYYDWSYIEYISGSGEPPAGTIIDVEFEVFQINSTTGEYYFTIDSYPNGLDPSDIPIYVAENGNRYNLRECFDFRPYISPHPSFSYVDVGANFINDDVDTLARDFTTWGAPFVPAQGSYGQADIDYYLSRYDLVVLSSYGDMELIKGEEELTAAPPKVESDRLAIAEIFIPGSPALSQAEAANQGKREYAAKARPLGARNYTMKDLQKIERKIQGLEYYISLNQLESETSNLVVTDENGLNRFKNGFIVEPFNDLNLADIRNPRYSAAVKFNQKLLTPAVRSFPIDLKYASSTNSSIFPALGDTQVVTLERNSHVDIINQPFATNSRNCVSNFYKYVGLGYLSPPYDGAFDTTVNPVNLDIDLTEPLTELVDNIQEISPLTDTTVTTQGVNPLTGGGTQTTVTSSLQISGEASITQEVGEFVTDFSMNPYMAARDVKIFMSGLRPNTRHYFWFDKVDVNNRVHPGSEVNKVELVQRKGAKGAAVTSDSNGVLRAVFALPADTFFVGERVLEIYDVSQYSDIESASTSGGFCSYNAYNFSIEKASLTATTRFPTYDVSQVTTVRNLPQRPIVRNDPLAQTFFIKEGMGQGSKTVYVSKIDLYFKRKSAINGVTVQLREVLNGYPTSKIIPFSSIHLTAGEVAISDDASAVTTVEFQAPVRLDTEKEYCFVVQPDANDPDYLIFTSKVGNLDLTPGATNGLPVVQDWGDGVLFTSTNNRAWKSYQDEDVKFTLYRHDFNQSSGTVTLTNNNNEFLTVSAPSGRFNKGEMIYTIKPLQGATQSNVSMVLGTNIITGVDLDDTYQVGEYIYVENAAQTEKDLFEIELVTATQITTVKPSSFTTNITGGNGNPAVVGDLSYYNFRNPTIMHLEASSASTKVFAAGDTIIGLDSEAQATIDSVDDISISYFQPLINKSNDAATKTTLTGEFIDPAAPLASYVTPLKFADDNVFNTKGALIYSHSNDPTNLKAFNIIVNTQNGGNSTSTPIVDVETSKLLCYQYKVTNDSNTTAAYIGKRIELAADLDAEDIQVILTGYKPIGTDIKVYARPQNNHDSDSFDSIPWIELELTEGVGIFSSSTNIRDFREFTYKIPAASKIGGVTSYTTLTGGTFEGFRRFAIKIELLSENNYIVPRCKDFRALALS